MSKAHLLEGTVNQMKCSPVIVLIVLGLLGLVRVAGHFAEIVKADHAIVAVSSKPMRDKPITL